LNNFSDRIMDAIADSLSTKICFVVFCIIASVPLFFQHPADVLGWDQYISQTVIQLVALSVLAIVSKNEGREQQRVLKETHDYAMQELSLIKDDLALAKEEREELKQLLAHLHVKIPDVIRQSNL